MTSISTDKLDAILAGIDFAGEARALKHAVSASAYPSADGGADIDNDALPQIEITLRSVAERAAARAFNASRSTIEDLRRERDEARQIVRDIYWMALRYADGRKSYAVGMCNDAVQKGYDGGWLPAKSDGGDPITPRLAHDGMSAEWVSITARLEAAERELALVKESGWKPIESAPKDGTPFLAWFADMDWPETIRWFSYSAEDAAEMGEPGYFHYAEEVLQNIVDTPPIDDLLGWRPLPPAPTHGEQE